MAGKKKRARNRSKQGRPNAPVPVRGFDTAIERAQKALEQNRAQDALRLAETGLTFINPARNPQAAGVIHQLMAEAHFRLGVEAVNPQEQERHLAAALKLDPKDTRIHFHRAITHFRQGRPAEADAALAKAGDHPGVAYVRSLAQLASGKPWTESGLAAEEVNTLRLLQAFHQDQPVATLHNLTRQPLLSSSEPWRALIALRADISAGSSEYLNDLASQLPTPRSQGVFHYYAGLVNINQDRKPEARKSWLISATKGWHPTWFEDNNMYLSREGIIALAQEENWQEIVTQVDLLPNPDVLTNDRILAETVGTAYFTLGYEAAQAGKWQKAAELLRKASKFTGGRTLAQNLALCEEALENWDAAGDAWREMARRRPRSEKHPDYMTDAQVAALWAHAAECYKRSRYPTEEVVNCLRTAVKYAGDDVDMRVKLADALIEADRKDAAENELVRILEIDAQHIPSLLSLAHLRADQWGKDPITPFRQVLALDPTHQEARDGLAETYLRQAEYIDRTESILSRLPNKLIKKSNPMIKHLQGALEAVPNHPALLMELGTQYRAIGAKKEAKSTLLAAYAAEPDSARVAGFVMHDLLHMDEDGAAEQVMADFRDQSNLLMPFWVAQGEKVLACKLGNEWAIRFFDEALHLAEKGRGTDTRALALLQIVDATLDKQADDLTDHYLNLVRAEMPRSGILEFAEARALFDKTRDKTKAQRLLRRAVQLATKAGDQAVIDQIEHAQNFVSGRMNPFADILGDLGKLDDDLIERLLGDFEDLFDDSDLY